MKKVAELAEDSLFLAGLLFLNKGFDDMGGGKMGMSPKISICVIVYNHEKYITDCLEGIRNQKGAPTFEVVICDDASVDHTESIVRSYIERHQLSNFIYHRAEVNAGMTKNFLTATSLCRGELIAFCEGDDYWTDPEKLRKQYSLMGANPGCAISAHSCCVDTPNGIRHNSFYRGDAVRHFDLHEVFSSSSTQFAPTASYMVRKSVVQNLPPWFNDVPIVDFFLEIFSLKQGYGLYMPDQMSAYRVLSQGSWSSSMKNDRRRSIDYGMKMLNIISILENDEILQKNGLHIFKANIYALLAGDFLLCGEFVTFRKYIEMSFSLDNSWQSKTAKSLYLLRQFPSLASFLYHAKRKYFV